MGPWCLLVCLIEGRPIPNLPWPVLNVAMSECNISCSHLSKTEKSELKNKIQTMGGIYTDNMTKKVTHLVTDSVNSQKYHVCNMYFVLCQYYLIHVLIGCCCRRS